MLQATPVSGTGNRTRPCELCAKATEQRSLYYKWGYEILRCNSCGLVSTAAEKDRAVIENPTEFYGGDYFEGGMRDGYVSYDRERHVLKKQFSRFLRRHVLRFRSSGDLLDVGCAYGYAVEAASANFSASGIDVSEHAVRFAQKNGLNCSVGTLQSLEGAEKYDVITLLDCIEHLPTPRQDIERAFQLLRPGGILVVTTGNIAALYPQLAGRFWRLMTPPQHLFFFSDATLTKLITNAGFEVIRKKVDWKYVPISLAAYQLLSRLRLPAGWAKWLPGGLPMSLFDTITIVGRKNC